MTELIGASRSSKSFTKVAPNGSSTDSKAVSVTNSGNKVQVIVEKIVNNEFESKESQPPIESVLEPPSFLARYTCVAVLLGIFSIWGNFVFIDEDDVPNGGDKPLHNGLIPLALTAFYLMSLPLLHMVTNHCNLQKKIDVKLMLRESMILYNALQVLLNGWMVYRILDALLWRNHPFIAGPIHQVDTGAAYAVWVHYCDKYLEYLDTYFMIVRGKMDQVCFSYKLLVGSKLMNEVRPRSSLLRFSLTVIPLS
jgi:GNS1/SUR4 family